MSRGRWFYAGQRKAAFEHARETGLKFYKVTWPPTRMLRYYVGAAIPKTYEPNIEKGHIKFEELKR